MRILAADTATMTCSVALLEEDVVAAEYSLTAGLNHSAWLMPTISRVFSDSGRGIADVDALAVAIGPGSFTGLRVGLAAMKGIAIAARKPLVGVDTLDALAYAFLFADQLVCPVLDARMGEVYAALYRPLGGKLNKQGEDMVLSVEELFRHVEEATIIFGTGASRHKEDIVKMLGDRAVFPNQGICAPRASRVAMLAAERLKRGQPDDPNALEPIYLRKSEAERKRGCQAQTTGTACR
jgi:tRNA threonylcarbamoyladenosine biosynthesis protein TsaB